MQLAALALEIPTSSPASLFPLEGFGKPFQEGFLPFRDLNRVHLILGRDLLDGFLPLQRFQRYPGFERRVVSSAFGFHCDGLSGCGFSHLQAIAFYSLPTGPNSGVHLKKLDRIQIQFDALDNDKLRLLVISEYNIREVERKANANGGESIAAKPWRKKKEQLSSDVALSGDGSALFTDGEKVYRIAAGRMKKPELTIYSVEKNRLTR